MPAYCGEMNKKIAIELDSNEWGQIIDGLTIRAESYENTVQYYETGYADELIEEVGGVYEARAIAEFYRSIIEKVQKQLVQGG